MKRLLMIAFYFPPRNHIASYRTGCFAKYLPENGWLPTVICEDWPSGRADYDPEFVGVIPPEVQLVRIAHRPPVSFYEKVILRKLFPYWRPYCVPYAWWHEARAAIEKLTAQTPFHAFWATSDPLTPLGLAAAASARQGLPWIADIRDSFNVQKRHSWYKRPLWAYHERRLCRLANRIITISPGLGQGLSAAVGKPVTIIENGYDPALFQAPLPPAQSVFTLVFTGNLVLPHQNPTPLFQAVAQCLDQGAIPRDKIEMIFYGPTLEQLAPFMPGTNQSLPIRVHPKVSHQAAIAIQRAGSVLIMFTHPGERGVLTGKIFDYLAAGPPILAVPDDQGDVAAVLRRTGTGVVASTVEEIALLLTNWHRLWHTNKAIPVPRNESEIAFYSRQAQTKRLASLLEELA